MSATLAAAFLIIFAASTFLVLHCAYEDGLIGRAALVAMALSALMVLLSVFVGDSEYAFTPETKLLVYAVALFMTRHAYRFVRWRVSGDGTWRGKGKG